MILPVHRAGQALQAVPPRRTVGQRPQQEAAGADADGCTRRRRRVGGSLRTTRRTTRASSARGRSSTARRASRSRTSRTARRTRSCWSRPRRRSRGPSRKTCPFDEGKLLPKVGGLFDGIFKAAMCDGSVRTFPMTMKEDDAAGGDHAQRRRCVGPEQVNDFHDNRHVLHDDPSEERFFVLRVSLQLNPLHPRDAGGSRTHFGPGCSRPPRRQAPASFVSSIPARSRTWSATFEGSRAFRHTPRT